MQELVAIMKKTTKIFWNERFQLEFLRFQSMEFGIDSIQVLITIKIEGSKDFNWKLLSFNLDGL